MWEEYVNYKALGNYHHPYFKDKETGVQTGWVTCSGLTTCIDLRFEHKFALVQNLIIFTL